MASTLGMSTPSAIRRELARIAQSAAANAVKVSARWAGVVLAVGEEQLGGDVRDEAGVGAGQQAQRVGEFAGEAAGVGDEGEVDQDFLQPVFGHRAQDGQVQAVVRSALSGPPPSRRRRRRGWWRGGEVQAAAQVRVGEGGHHDAVVRRPAVLDGLGEGILEDLLPVHLLVVHGVGERVHVRVRPGGTAAGAGDVGGLGQLGGGEDAGVAVM
ncbi:hypothetical protein [Streptomyces scabiei]|uniref:hypothetical protein n=1 Tax=Streptomyces scabiei TaxID=1930 RepID=UPI001FF1B687|nr:hypothetical protein [Streptomyces sp. LBUM 1482]